MTTTSRITRSLAAGAALLLAACADPTVPDLNNPSVEGILTNPTRAQVQALATGLLIGTRASAGPEIRDMEIFGRDMYNLDAADPRWVSELLANLDPGGFGGNHWTGRYRTIKGANIMISSVETSVALSDEEKSAAYGYANTMKAAELLALVETRDVAGIAADAAQTTSQLEPLVCRGTALGNIVALLDEAYGQLQAGGDEFPFGLSSGFAGFDTPATFAQYNRALLAQAEIYRGATDAAAYGRALAALAQTWVDTTADLDEGIYHVFSLASGDLVNPLFQAPATANLRAHPSVATDAEAGDRRLAAKVTVGDRKEFQGVSSNLIITRYEDATSPIPVVRNEELILLRAQANIGLNTPAGRTAALADLNAIRTRSGGLAARGAFADQEAAITELLRQKRYSLLFESGSRWVDHRLYGRLTGPNGLPIDRANDVVHPNMPIPTNEQLARGSVACTGT